MNNLVSVVIPIYNVENYLRKCVDSVLGQTYRNLEIILVDDGSPDKSGPIADEYEELDTRVKVIHKENGGLSDARNAGLQVANGDYICFIDSDDYVELNMVEAALSKIEKANADVIVFGFFNEKLDNEENIVKIESELPYSNNPLSILLTSGYAWNKLYKTSYIRNRNFQFTKGLSLVEDIVFNEQVLLNTDKVEYLDKAFYHYINRPRLTLVKQYHEDSYNLHKIGWECRKNILSKTFGLSSKTKMIIASSHINGIRYCCTNMFYYSNNLKLKMKYENIKVMIHDSLTSDQIKFYQTSSLSDILIKFSIKSKLTSLLFFIYYARSFYMLNKQKVDD